VTLLLVHRRTTISARSNWGAYNYVSSKIFIVDNTDDGSTQRQSQHFSLTVLTSLLFPHMLIIMHRWVVNYMFELWWLNMVIEHGDWSLYTYLLARSYNQPPPVHHIFSHCGIALRRYFVLQVMWIIMIFVYLEAFFYWIFPPLLCWLSSSAPPVSLCSPITRNWAVTHSSTRTCPVTIRYSAAHRQACSLQHLRFGRFSY